MGNQKFLLNFYCHCRGTSLLRRATCTTTLPKEAINRAASFDHRVGTREQCVAVSFITSRGRQSRAVFQQHRLASHLSRE